MVFGSREMVSGHRSMVLPGSDMPSALGLVLSNLVILIFLHRIFFLNPITKCKFLFIIMKFFSKAKLDDDNTQYLVQKNHSHPYQKFTFTFLADFSIPHI